MEQESHYMLVNITELANELAERKVSELIQIGSIKNPYVQLTNGIQYSNEVQERFERLHEYYWNIVHEIAHH